MTEATWLPNLVAGTSIWKLGVDLNEPKYFDGRLLVPETEGSESLPVTVRWDLTGLVPLEEARASHPDEVLAAIKEFQGCLEHVAKLFATPNSGFDKYKDAFTVPSLEGAGAANYFYSPSKKRLFVINWGASPRSMGGKAEYVFGYEDWGKRWGGPAAAVVAGAAPADAGVAAGIAGGAAAAATAAKDADEKKTRREEENARPWWILPLFALIAIAVVLLALFFLKACDEAKPTTDADASDAPFEAASATAAEDAGAALLDDAGEDGGATASDAGADAGADAASAADAGADAGADAASTADAGADAGKDGGPFTIDEDDDDDGPEGSSGGAGSSGGVIEVKIGPGGGAKTGVHRKHYSDEAVKWRVSAGAEKVSRTEQRGQRFDVWLSPGQSFEGVRVEWQDRAGGWHVH